MDSLRELSFCASDDEVRLAREEYARDGRIEIPDPAMSSVADDGVWVQAWVWVAKKDNTKG